MKEIKKVALYYRVSSPDQVDKDTIENQKILLPQWAKEQGWDVVAEFEDPGLTGIRMELRPDFLAMLGRVKAKEFDAVGVRHSDRLTRTEDLEEWGLIYGASQKSKTLVASPYEGVMDLSDLSGQMMAFFRGRISAEESRKTKQRQIEGISRKHSQGHYASGHIPFGISWDKDSKKWFRNEKEYSVLVEMIRLLKAGAGARKIASTFNADLEKFPTRRYLLKQHPNYKPPAARTDRKLKPKSEYWASGTVWVIVNSDFLFTGQINTKAGVIDTGIKLFSRDDIIQARHFMKQRTRKASQKMKVIPNRFLLRRLIRCGVCGVFLGINEARNHYRCSKCGTSFRDADWIDGQVWDRIVETFGDKEKLIAAIQNQEFVADRKLVDLERDKTTALKKLEGLNEGKEKLNELYVLDSKMVKSQYEKLYSSLDRQEKSLRSELTRVENTLSRSADLDAAISRATDLIVCQLQSACVKDEGTRQAEFSAMTAVARDKSRTSAGQLFEQKKQLLNRLVMADGQILAYRDKIVITGMLSPLKDVQNVDSFNSCPVHPVR